ncbi:MAG: hypothetical protein MRERC_3c149 [Mycoplasmataceae bacterium RC_NB112A]|nr:MAG: hypothetical protein MRERC_3c149 [Mycoplasmataceae bacterium RC_NB112A]
MFFYLSSCAFHYCLSYNNFSFLCLTAKYRRISFILRMENLSKK